MKATIHTDSEGRKVYVLDIMVISRFALLLIFPIMLFMALPFFLLWGENVLVALKFKPLLFLLLFIVLGAAVHELLHAVVWALFARGGFRAIRFGLKWEYVSPYCHCKVPLKVWQYILGGIAPLVLMGIIPSVYALITGNALLMFLGMFFTWSAAGDMATVWVLRRINSSKWVHDHPSELGFIINDSEK